MVAGKGEFGGRGVPAHTVNFGVGRGMCPNSLRAAAGRANPPNLVAVVDVGDFPCEVGHGLRAIHRHRDVIYQQAKPPAIGLGGQQENEPLVAGAGVVQGGNGTGIERSRKLEPARHGRLVLAKHLPCHNRIVQVGWGIPYHGHDGNPAIDQLARLGWFPLKCLGDAHVKVELGGRHCAGQMNLLVDGGHGGGVLPVGENFDRWAALGVGRGFDLGVGSRPTPRRPARQLVAKPPVANEFVVGEAVGGGAGLGRGLGHTAEQGQEQNEEKGN